MRLFLCFLCLWPLSLGVTSPEKLFCSLCKTILNIRYLIIILQISLEKGECFDFNHALGCIYPTLNTIRLLGQVYHFSLLICYPCSFYFHAWMLVALWEWNSLFLITLWKTRNLPQILISWLLLLFYPCLLLVTLSAMMKSSKHCLQLHKYFVVNALIEFEMFSKLCWEMHPLILKSLVNRLSPIISASILKELLKELMWLSQWDSSYSHILKLFWNQYVVLKLPSSSIFKGYQMHFSAQAQRKKIHPEKRSLFFQKNLFSYILRNETFQSQG